MCDNVTKQLQAEGLGGHQLGGQSGQGQDISRGRLGAALTQSTDPQPMNIHSLIEHEIQACYTRAAELRALADCLPSRVPYDATKALRDLLLLRRRIEVG